MISKTPQKNDQLQMISIEQLVPQDHLLRKIDSLIDFNFIYDLVEDKYCPDNGRPSIDPVTLIKIPLIQYMYGIKDKIDDELLQHIVSETDSEEELLKIDGKKIIAPIQTGDEMNEVNDPEEVAAIKDIYLADLQAHADDYGELAIEIKEETEVSGVTIVAQYIDKNGEVMAEAEFTAEDVEE